MNFGISPEVRYIFVLALLLLSAASYSDLLYVHADAPTTVPVENGPNVILFDPVNGDLYVVDFELGNVTVVSGTNNSVVASINLHLLRSPWETALNPSNNCVGLEREL